MNTHCLITSKYTGVSRYIVGHVFSLVPSKFSKRHRQLHTFHFNIKMNHVYSFHAVLACSRQIKPLFLSSSFNSHPTIKHTATSLQILLSQPTTATSHTLKQFLLLYIKHKLPLALCHKDSFSSQSSIYLEACFSMKIGVKPSDLAYHVFNASHPLTLHKEELLADIVHFPKYSREAFLKDIAAHSNLKPVSGLDSFTLAPLSSTRNLNSSTPAQKTFQLRKDQKAILEHLTLELETKLDTKRWVFGGDSSVEGPTYDYSQTSEIDNPESTSEYLSFPNLFPRLGG